MSISADELRNVKPGDSLFIGRAAGTRTKEMGRIRPVSRVTAKFIMVGGIGGYSNYSRETGVCHGGVPGYRSYILRMATEQDFESEKAAKDRVQELERAAKQRNRECDQLRSLFPDNMFVVISGTSNEFEISITNLAKHQVERIGATLKQSGGT